MKKTLSVLLSILMMLSVITPFNVFADDSVSVEYSVCDAGVFTLTPQAVTVTADLSDKYEKQVGYNDKKDYPTILDATIAAHIAMFGEDFVDSDYFQCSSPANTTAAFGEETYALSYRLNGKTGEGETWFNMDSQVKNGDYVEFMFYQDTDYWSDYYTSFDKRDVTITLGQSVTLNVSADMFGMPAETTEGLTITDLTWTEGYGTVDENSQFTFTPAKAGTYYLTAYGDIDYCPIFAPYCKVTVNKTDLQKEVEKDIEDEIKYLNIKPTVANSYDASTLSRATEFDSRSYFVDLKKNLSDNNGKIIVDGKENAVYYAAAINILVNEDTDPTSFGGYDIVKAFESLTDKTVTNPYYYRVIVEACKNINNDNLAKEYIDQLIKENYTMGKGMNYWGYSCDNTAMFLTAIAPYKDDYKAYVEDAIKVIDSYTTSKGCFYNDTYTDISPDSTAVALMAYSAVGKYDMANFLYRCLMDGFESKTDNGVIVLNGSNNDYATKEALLALTYFDTTKVKHTNIATDQAIKATCITEGKTEGKHCNDCGEIFVAQKVINALGDAGHNPVISVKAKSATHFATGKTAEYKCSVCGKVTTKSKSVATKKATISKLSAGKKSFKITTKKVDKATGYQIQYSTNSSFKNAKSYKTKYTTKTISKLKAKKKYYVRVRAYKKSNGKTTYSSWSASKTVKTK